MLLRKLLDAIKSRLPDRYIKISPGEIARLNSDKITIENVRSILNTSYGDALDICEMAVKEGYFAKKTAIYRPDGSIDLLLGENQPVPETIHIYEEIDGHYEEKEVETDNLTKRTVYSLAI